MTQLTIKELGNQIRKSVQALHHAQDAETAIYDHCETVYGLTPSDVDCEAILDTVFGYCGRAVGLSPKTFDKEMHASIALMKRTKEGIE